MSKRNLAREVLDDEEFADYMAVRRLELPLVSEPPPTPHLADEHGFDRQGRYYIERDMG